MDVDKVFDLESTTSYMDMLNGSAVNLDTGIDAFDGECNVKEIDDEEEDEGDEEEVVEVDPAAAGSSSTPKPRTANYSEIEDVILVRAWSKVGMDACTGVDQGGKRYWQRIEDQYHQLKPRTKSMADRSYRSLEGRWNIIKPACSRWSAAMDQVADNPPSGCVPEDYVSFPCVDDVETSQAIHIVLMMWKHLLILLLCSPSMLNNGTRTWPAQRTRNFNFNIAFPSFNIFLNGSCGTTSQSARRRHFSPWMMKRRT
jgi:hypothetical protein